MSISEEEYLLTLPTACKPISKALLTLLGATTSILETANALIDRINAKINPTLPEFPELPDIPPLGIKISDIDFNCAFFDCALNAIPLVAGVRSSVASIEQEIQGVVNRVNGLNQGVAGTVTRGILGSLAKSPLGKALREVDKMNEKIRLMNAHAIRQEADRFLECVEQLDPNISNVNTVIRYKAARDVSKIDTTTGEAILTAPEELQESLNEARTISEEGKASLASVREDTSVAKSQLNKYF